MKTSPSGSHVRIVYDNLLRYNRLILLAFMAVALLQVWLTRYVPSLDGPQHLYNANVMKQLLSGDDLFKEFFRFNRVVVGYWTGHFLLGLFRLFLPAWLAEKFFLTAYILGMFFSFRYLVEAISGKKANLMVYLIFPFIFHMYMLLGYYTFSYAAIFFFWAFGYYIRVRDRLGWKEAILFGALVLGVYLSHALVFLFFGVAFLLYYTAGIFYERRILRSGLTWKTVLIRTGKLGLSVLPALVLWIVYIRSVMDINDMVSPAAGSSGELLRELLRIRQLVGFNHKAESPALVALIINLILLSMVPVYAFIQKRQKGEGRRPGVANPAYIWAVLSLVFLLGYFLLPDRVSAGSLTHRFGLYFFLCWIICLATVPIPEWLQIGTLFLLLAVTGITRLNQHRFLKSLNNDIADIQQMNQYMEEGSTVAGFNASSNWIHAHFLLYTGVDSRQVHLNNPQCAGQFPVVWNENSLPVCLVGPLPYRPLWSPDVEGLQHREVMVDYITLYHWNEFWKNDTNNDWKKVITEEYELVMTTSRDLGALYKRKSKSAFR